MGNLSDINFMHESFKIIYNIKYVRLSILNFYTEHYFWQWKDACKFLNPLRAKFFRGNIKHIFPFYVIPPHWYDTGGWNPSSNKTRTYSFYIVSIMAAGVLATQGARTSAAIGIDTKIEVIVASPTTWEAHHSPRAKPEGCGELPRSLVTQQWPKWRYQFLFYHDETKSITNKQKNAR